jgi:hypothetical protein
MGGSVYVESTPGKGSIFRFELPQRRAARRRHGRFRAQAMLACLPAGLREELRAALESLDSEHMAGAVKKAVEFDAEPGRTLRPLLENFE